MLHIVHVIAKSIVDGITLLGGAGDVYELFRKKDAKQLLERRKILICVGIGVLICLVIIILAVQFGH